MNLVHAPSYAVSALSAPTGRWVGRWAVASQQQARRNAMLASTACMQRRIEREDVEDFLAARYPVAAAAEAAQRAVSRDTLRRSRA